MMKIEEFQLPINKTAAVVVLQKDCSEDITDEQKRENLVAKLRSIEKELSVLKKGMCRKCKGACSKPRKPKGCSHVTTQRRKFLAGEVSRLGLEISKIRKNKPRQDIEKYVLDILREDLTRFQFDRLLSRARERLDSCNAILTDDKIKK